ncbi:helix-turn-helix domain-containing protein [Stenotrophomonas maltophilia]|uniref:IclR family transcriptional regulator n=1 Tax=Stenotrophomonas TaxID=40323 RepID=UPI0018D3EF59|nr:helix-turn-helix domain-containing protein [Stenotrophomonas maltophilia]MBH1816823.1 helix-turn-helix domain-containing protein [Stenotrophomonas maltophilia]MCU1029716.1 helix-turn-helix domain-containing protein [Stenotrophomonas maltophilia]
MGEEEKSGGVQVIARAAAILEVLGRHPQGLSLGDISNRVSLPRSTVQRIVSALESAHFVRNEGAGGIGLGAGLLRLMSSAHADLVSVVKPALQELSDSTNETVVLSRMSGAHLMVEHRLVADRELQVIPRLGLSTLGLHQTSAGRALLSLESEPNVLARMEPHVSHPDALLRQLGSIRAMGYASDEAELMEGITTSAVGVDSILGRFAVSLPIPTIRFERNRENYLEQLVASRRALEAQIGVPSND